MVDRDYILKRIKTRGVTVGEFNWERLQAPPLTSLLSPWDIQNLEDISTSIRLTANLKKKYELIDSILRPRGFKKFINGTNRVCYEFIEDKSFMIKVAIDSVGAKDGPAEFKNQFIFKPFVPKIFEVSPRGCVGLCERVTPITNEEEFRAVAEDIYTVINEVFVGEYVLADIGTKFFMNWGIREGFGPVLLDFPYIYKLDGKKLFCNAPDPRSQTGYCNSPIDYDSGYNFLVCTKCGKQYKASDLRCDGDNRKIICRETGGNKMKVRISGGNNDTKKTVVVGDDGMLLKQDTMPVNDNKAPKTVKTEPKIETVEAPKEYNPKNVQPAPEPKKTETVFTYMGDKFVSEERPVEEKVEPKKMEVNNTPKKKEVTSPIKFVTEEEKMQTMEKILDHINEIRSLSGLLTNDEAIDLTDILIDLMIEIENRPNMENQALSSYVQSIEKAALIYSKLSDDDKKEALDSNFTKEIVDNYNEVYGEEVTDFGEFEEVDPDEIEEEIAEEEVTEEVEEEIDETVEDDEVDIQGFCFVNGSVQNLKDIDPNQPSKKVIVLTDNDDNYILSSNREIISIDTVDNRSMDSVSVVSKEYLDNVQKIIETQDGADNIDDDDEDALIEAIEGGEE